MDVPPPIPGNRPKGYELPPRPAQPQYSGSQYTEQQDQSAPPPPLPPRQQAPPPPPPRPTREPSGGSEWGPLFYRDGQPTPEFKSIMTALFAKLDPQGTGTITPETLSWFLDLQGFAPEDNLWKKNCKPHILFPAQEMGDYELKAVYESWRFDHTSTIRNPGAAHQLPGGGMPLLYLEGFIDYFGVEHAADGSRGYRGLNVALSHFGFWPERGPIPRTSFLTDIPPELQARIDTAVIRSRQIAQERITAARVQADIQARGRQAALDLIGDYRYEYRYVHR